MITEEEYKKWKPLIEEYEHEEFQRNSLEAIYCDECQALEIHDCFCDDYDEDEHICNECSGEGNNHYRGCSMNCNPYDQLMELGYD